MTSSKSNSVGNAVSSRGAEIEGTTGAMSSALMEAGKNAHFVKCSLRERSCKETSCQ